MSGSIERLHGLTLVRIESWGVGLDVRGSVYVQPQMLPDDIFGFERFMGTVIGGTRQIDNEFSTGCPYQMTDFRTGVPSRRAEFFIHLRGEAPEGPTMGSDACGTFLVESGWVLP